MDDCVRGGQGACVRVGLCVMHVGESASALGLLLRMQEHRALGMATEAPLGTDHGVPGGWWRRRSGLLTA